MDNVSEKLIESVKKYPILYDSSHRDHKSIKEKDKVWDELGVELNTDGDTLKKKWKNLRDCYAKYMRSDKTKTGQLTRSTTYYKSWPWAKQMDAFKPFLKFARNESNASLLEELQLNLSEDNEVPYRLDTVEVTQDREDVHHQQIQQDYLQSREMPSKKRKLGTRGPRADNATDTVMKYFEQKRAMCPIYRSELTAIEHMFLSFAKTVENFSPRRQVMTKMKIANIVMEEELLQKEEEERGAIQSASSSSSIAFPLPVTEEDHKTTGNLSGSIFIKME